MKTIEERAREYAKKEGSISLSEVYNQALAEIYEKAYIVGANEQKEIDEEVRLKKSDEMTKAEYDREVAFAYWYLKNGKGTPTYSDAIEWARQELIDWACKWFEGYLAEIGYPDDWYRDSEVQESGEKRFRKFMDANTVDNGIKRRTSKTWVLNGKKIRSYKKLVEELKKIEI